MHPLCRTNSKQDALWSGTVIRHTHWQPGGTLKPNTKGEPSATHFYGIPKTTAATPEALHAKKEETKCADKRPGKNSQRTKRSSTKNSCSPPHTGILEKGRMGTNGEYQRQKEKKEKAASVQDLHSGSTHAGYFWERKLSAIIAARPKPFFSFFLPAFVSFLPSYEE